MIIPVTIRSVRSATVHFMGPRCVSIVMALVTVMWRVRVPPVMVPVTLKLVLVVILQPIPGRVPIVMALVIVKPVRVMERVMHRRV